MEPPPPAITPALASSATDTANIETFLTFALLTRLLEFDTRLRRRSRMPPRSPPRPNARWMLLTRPYVPQLRPIHPRTANR